MTVDEYYAIVKRLGLRPSNVPHVYVSVGGDFHSVPDPSKHSEAQRAETIERLKLLLGIGKRDE
jgi:hypothetical protein